MSLVLSRVRLRHAPDTAALARLLLPEDEDARIAAGHRLIWSLFADAPDRERDFLWREDGGSAWQRTTFLVLSARAPSGGGGLFEVESKPFEPALSAGQPLRFRLRAAPSFSVPSGTKGERGKRVDPVWHEMNKDEHRLRTLSPDARQELRLKIERDVLGGWLVRQGERSGFRPVTVPDEKGVARPVLTIDGDVQRRLPYDAKRLRETQRDGARRKHPTVAFTTFDLEGEIVVEDPDRFLAQLPKGFGRAKAFGCGLMLIRRP